MATIEQIQDQIIDEFAIFHNWQDKYTHIIELGRSLAPLELDDKIEQNIVKGCQSLVWLTSKLNNQKVQYYADSDALIVRGLIALLLRVYHDQRPQDIINISPYFIEKIGMQDHLSMTRKNGLDRIIKQIKYYALAYNSLLNQQ